MIKLLHIAPTSVSLLVSFSIFTLTRVFLDCSQSQYLSALPLHPIVNIAFVQRAYFNSFTVYCRMQTTTKLRDCMPHSMLAKWCTQGEKNEFLSTQQILSIFTVVFEQFKNSKKTVNPLVEFGDCCIPLHSTRILYLNNTDFKQGATPSYHFYLGHILFLSCVIKVITFTLNVLVSNRPWQWYCKAHIEPLSGQIQIGTK